MAETCIPSEEGSLHWLGHISMIPQASYTVSASLGLQLT